MSSHSKEEVMLETGVDPAVLSSPVFRDRTFFSVEKVN